MKVLPYGLIASKTSILLPYCDYWAVTDSWTTTFYPKTETGLREAIQHINENKAIDLAIKGGY